MRMMMFTGASRDRVPSGCNNVIAHSRETVGTSAAGNNLASTNDVPDGDLQHKALNQGSFAALGATDNPGQVDEEEDFGGLMVRITSIRSRWDFNFHSFSLHYVQLRRTRRSRRKVLQLLRQRPSPSQMDLPRVKAQIEKLQLRGAISPLLEQV
jgi:hypothetical protein